jgi:hypothetical protein
MHSVITIKASKIIREYGDGTINNNERGIFGIKPYNAFEFDIYYNDSSLFASCRPSSKLRCILSFEDLFLGDFLFLNRKDEILRIRFKGLFGLKRSLIHKEREFSFSRFRRRKEMNFYESIFSFEFGWNGSLKSTTSDENYLDELICASSYLWYRRERYPF